MINTIKHTFLYGKYKLSLETGYLATQTTASVIVNMENTTILTTVVIDPESIKISNMVPLSVYYQERFYAAGKIPNSFFKREGRPNETEILKARLIDRCLRPLFPSNFFTETQITITVLSLNPQIDTTVVSLIASSTALTIANIGFKGPVGIAQIGFINNNLILNPSPQELNDSHLNFIVCGTKKSIIMVEGEAKCITKELMLNTIVFGHKQQQCLINNIIKFAAKVNIYHHYSHKKLLLVIINKKIKKKITLLMPIVIKLIKNLLQKAFLTKNKQVRLEKIKWITSYLFNKLNQLKINYDEDLIKLIMYKIMKNIIRNNIIKYKIRLDHRSFNDIRPIDIKLNILPRTHGSALFTRGETQALVVITLGTIKQGQIIDELYSEHINNFIVHYNFPPYAVKEIGILSSPKRREIGHGNLIKKGLTSIMPILKKFPYTIRIVSEIISSNGSSSMASVCGASLALMDAGIPIESHVAGIAMGLIKHKQEYVILSDINGEEDNYGDMDLKVVGNPKGLTAIQLDIKRIDIDYSIIQESILQAMHDLIIIINKMNDIIKTPKVNLSTFVPKIKILKIDPIKIKEIIGKGGIVIKSITEDTSTTIEIQNDGYIIISALHENQINSALARIHNIINNFKIGNIYLGKIIKITEVVVLIALNNSIKGVLDIANISSTNLNNLKKYFTLGQKILVQIINIDHLGQIKLDIKN